MEPIKPECCKFENSVMLNTIVLKMSQLANLASNDLRLHNRADRARFEMISSLHISNLGQYVLVAAVFLGPFVTESRFPGTQDTKDKYIIILT